MWKLAGYTKNWLWFIRLVSVDTLWCNVDVTGNDNDNDYDDNDNKLPNTLLHLCHNKDAVIACKRRKKKQLWKYMISLLTEVCVEVSDAEPFRVV